jgi:predicted site-specific integrase-resolvase
VAEDRPAKPEADRLVPIAEASARLRRSVWTLKRYFAKGWLPVVIAGANWFVPESFIEMLWASIRPGRAANFAEVAGAWFAANGYAEAVAS